MRAGQLAQGRDAEREAVAIGRAGSADDHDGGQRRGGGRRGLRQRAGEREPVRGNPDALVVRPRDDDLPRRHRRDVVAGDVDVLRGHRQAQEPAVFVAPDVQIERQVRRRDRDVRPARGDQPRRRLDLLGRRCPRPSATATPAAGCTRETSGRAWPCASCAASASYGAKSAFGRTIAPASMGSDLVVSLTGDRDVVLRGRAVEGRVDRLELVPERSRRS